MFKKYSRFKRLSAVCVLALAGCHESASAAPTKTQVASSAKPTATAPAPGGVMTVAQLQGDFKADSAKLMGQKAQVKGLYLNSIKAMYDGKTEWSIVVVGENGKMIPSVTCVLADEPKGLVQDDAVTVEGKVDKSFGEARLVDCTWKK